MDVAMIQGSAAGCLGRVAWGARQAAGPSGGGRSGTRSGGRLDVEAREAPGGWKHER